MRGLVRLGSYNITNLRILNSKCLNFGFLILKIGFRKNFGLKKKERMHLRYFSIKSVKGKKNLILLHKPH